MSRRHPQITVHMVAASDGAGESVLHVPLANGSARTASSTLTPSAGHAGVRHDVVPVATRTLDDLVGDAPPVSLIKCDVEGHEPAVIRGARRILTGSRPALLVEIEQRHRDDDIRGTFSELDALGYAGFALFPGGLRPVARFDVDRDQLRFLDGDPFADRALPADYVRDFLFVPYGSEIIAAFGLDPA